MFKRLLDSEIVSKFFKSMKAYSSIVSIALKDTFKVFSLVKYLKSSFLSALMLFLLALSTSIVFLENQLLFNVSIFVLDTFKTFKFS